MEEKTPANSPSADGDPTASDAVCDSQAPDEPRLGPVARCVPVLAPVTAGERIVTLDVLRGFAVFGILVMNVKIFAYPFDAYHDPTIAGGAEGLNLLSWAIDKVLVKGAMRGIFSLLFGAGVVLLTERAEARGGAARVADVYYRRNLWLILFGVVHACLLLFLGDILFFYGVVALFLFPFRKLTARRLVLLGALALAVAMSMSVYRTVGARSMERRATAAQAARDAGETLSEEEEQTLKIWERRQRKMSAEEVAEEVRLAHGGYVANFKRQIDLALLFHTVALHERLFWDVAGMMLLGMGLFKLGALAGRRPVRFYVLLGAAGYGVGVPLKLYVVSQILAHDFARMWVTINPFYDVSRLGVALGHVSVVLLLCKSGRLRWLTSSLAAVGRMALTNYVGHTVICATLFFGFGFSLFGVLERFQLYYVVGGIVVFQMVTSRLWLRVFRFGPCEWVWRSLTYWPWRRLIFQ